MSEVIEKPVIDVRRMTTNDVETDGLWLIPRLRHAYPYATDAAIKAALLAACTSNEQWIGRTENAAAACRSVPELLTGAPFAKSWFGVAKTYDIHGEEIAELFHHMTVWLRRSGMRVLIMPQHMDCDRSYIRSRIGKLVKDETFVWFSP